MLTMTISPNLSNAVFEINRTEAQERASFLDNTRHIFKYNLSKEEKSIVHFLFLNPISDKVDIRNYWGD
jgi:hypothetical protein